MHLRVSIQETATQKKSTQMPFKNPTWNFFTKERPPLHCWKSILFVGKKQTNRTNVTRCFSSVFERFSLVLKNLHYWRTWQLVGDFHPGNVEPFSRFKSTSSVVGQQSVILKLEVHQARGMKCHRCWAFQKIPGLLGGPLLSKMACFFNGKKWGGKLTPP